MSKIYTFFLFSLFCCNSFAQTISNPELLYYKFNETGSSVTNYAITPPLGTTTATIMGGVSQGSTGQCDGALIGTGVASSTDYLNTGWATDLNGTSWTISFWTNNITPSGTLFYIFGDVNASSFRCFTNGVAGANNWILRGGMSDVTATNGAVSGPSMTTFVSDLVAGTVSAYVNGLLVSTVAQAPPNIAGAGPFKVMGYNSNVGSPAGGLLDEFRVYNRALTSTEISNLYTRSNASSFLISSCGDYTAPSGAIYTTSGTYNDTIANVNCGDSVMTIGLTINQPSTSSIQTIACNSYTAPSGATFFSSGLYSDTIINSNGCDSIISLDLTINQSSSSSIQPAVCGSYLSPSGNTYSTSGIYYDTLINSLGCDSIITIDLTINQASTSTINVNSCFNYQAPDGSIYFQSGNIVSVIPNNSGCDSTININLTIDTVDNSISSNGLTLIATETNATYQWISCPNNSPISGEVSQQFSPITNGSYAVIVTSNGCFDTSTCSVVSIIGIDEPNSLGITLSPNPTKDFLIIENDSELKSKYLLLDYSGKVFKSEISISNKLDWNLNEVPAGIYFLKIENETGTVSLKVIKL